ncbi:MAG: DUF2284 domain-containing protein [Tissierellia bacterium]|nr:DUF2284 domain-containing protein [Tissierellia bacterium]
MKIIQHEKQISIEDFNSYMDISFIEYCKSCSHYGKKWSCTPLPEYPDLNQFKRVNLYAMQIIFSEFERKTFVDGAEIEFTKRLFKIIKSKEHDRLMSIRAKYPGSMAFASGDCILCEKCTREINMPCIRPLEMLISLDALGINIGKITKEQFGLDLKWNQNGLPEYYFVTSCLFLK